MSVPLTDILESMNKYHARKVKMLGMTFDSKREAEQYLYLKHQQDIGVISNLQMQVQFEILPKLIGYKEVKLKTKTKMKEIVLEQAVHYTADFVYNTNDGKTVILEVKSAATKLARDYPLRRKLLRRKLATEKGYENYIFKEIS